MIEVKVPRKSPIIGKVVKRYKTLFRQMKSCGEGVNYTEGMMWDNIRKALCIDGIFLEPSDLKAPIIKKWAQSNFKVFYHSHWYYAVKLLQTQQGDAIASVTDACYEGQYHNDRTKSPYPIKESQLRNIIRESLIRVLYN